MSAAHRPAAADPEGRRLQRRLMASLAVFTLGVSALFGLFAMAVAYAVEDSFIDRVLEPEAGRQRAHFAAHGRWAPPGAARFSVHASAASLPADLQPTLAAEPWRREAAGEAGRHYHLLSLQQGGEPPWLVAEVSDLLVVRPLRGALLGWLAGGGVAVAALALLLGAWVTRDFRALLARTRGFLAREQAFTRDASHELRTPLAVLGVAIERLLARPGLEAPVREQLAPMKAATALMSQTVDTLLRLAREDGARPGVPGPVAVLPLVEDWVLAHAEWLETRALTLDIQLGRHDRLALPEPVLRLALANLLGNALAHGQRGGSVRIAMDDGVLCISNPGEALPAGAGEAFVKGEGSAGFGLGLSILRRMLDSQGSGLEVRHRAGWTQVRVLACRDSDPPR